MKYYTLFQVHIKISNLLPSQYIIIFFFQPESLGCFDYEGSLMGNRQTFEIFGFFTMK